MKSPEDNWPEPIVRVQSLSESGICTIPTKYVKTLNERPSLNKIISDVNIPTIDLEGNNNYEEISEACRNWGFFQIVNHGVPLELMDEARQVWREFFHQPMDVKLNYANTPKTYEGYGSRLGIEKGAILDWSDYYFLHYLPCSLKDHNKWPALPLSLRYATATLKFYCPCM